MNLFYRLSMGHFNKKISTDLVVQAFLETTSIAKPLKSSTPQTLESVERNSILPLLATYLQQQPKIQRFWLTHPDPRTRQQLQNEAKYWNIQSHILPDKLKQLQKGQLDDPDNAAQRLQLLLNLSNTPNSQEVFILSPQALKQTVPDLQQLNQNALNLQLGGTIDLAELEQTLQQLNYEKVPQVQQRGQWAVRGGIVDLFSKQALQPLRIELFDREIESLREFDLHTQITRKKIKQIQLLLLNPNTEEQANSKQLQHYLKPSDKLIFCGEKTECLNKEPDLHLTCSPFTKNTPFSQPLLFHDLAAGDFVLQRGQRDLIFQQLQQWQDQHWRIFLFFTLKSELKRFNELLGDQLAKNNFTCIQAPLNKGCLFSSAKIALISCTQLFGKSNPPLINDQHLYQHRHSSLETTIENIKSGDLLVHQNYGICRLKSIEINDLGQEELQLRFANQVFLTLGIEQSHLLARYIGMGGAEPKLSTLGDGKWSNARKKTQASIEKYAAELLSIQAQRQQGEKKPFPPDDDWMQEFEASFPYQETEGQRQSIAETKADLEATKAMDRLICGDVGFGKTEVALRAAFKAATAGRQVALLVPTTVLAEQHWRTFSQRMSHYPLKIALLNRFRTSSENKKTLEGLKNGTVDIVIGTHRLLSDDVHFHNLGLAIIDEEQRFGVKHKEQFKKHLANIDLLTLSATPIPRTLYLSLMGARDMSTIETPPPNKVPVQTHVCTYDERLIRDAIRREMNRGGQVFFLHNRVKSIEKMQETLEKLVPEARVEIGHGQMNKKTLESVMQRFVNGEADILLATSIIESGIDIPNANTILIDRADLFGLADLYQLRGRVGRGQHKAYAILLMPPQLLTRSSTERLEAIQQHTALGSGFKIAMRDLEIRGAGNLLGTKQSGLISTVGFDLYCQMLRQSIQQLQGKDSKQRQNVTLRCDFLLFNQEETEKDVLACYLPNDYMPEPFMRIQAYKQLAEIQSLKTLKQLELEWRDRYGVLPCAVQHLITATKIKIAAAKVYINIVEIKQQKLLLTRNGEKITLQKNQIPRLTEHQAEKKLQECLTLLETI